MSVDLLIRGATVFPGGGPAFTADVAVAGGRIVAVEPHVTDRHKVGRVVAAKPLVTERHKVARETVDGTGLLLCPGFVDLHAHSALSPFSDPLQVPKVAQGFTTEVICPDGLAPAPVAAGRRDERRDYLRPLEGTGPGHWAWEGFDEYLDALDATRPATSLVPSAAHGAIRDLVVGPADVAPTGSQLAEMRAHVRAALAAGARMLSFGLVYLPGAHAGTDELVTLAEEAAAGGAPIVPHVRNEGAGLLEAVGEMIEVSRRSGAALHVSHLKALADEGMVGPLLELLDDASEEIEVTFDQYPYGAGSTLLASILPRWAQEGGADATLERLARPGDRAQIADDITGGLPGWENLLGTLGPDRITIAAAAAPNALVVGSTLADLARTDRRGRKPACDDQLQAGIAGAARGASPACDDQLQAGTADAARGASHRAKSARDDQLQAGTADAARGARRRAKSACDDQLQARIADAARGASPACDDQLQAGIDAALDLLLSSRLDVTMILHYAGEDAVREIARHRLQLVGSDGIFGPRPHPRLWGTAARFLGRYAIREGLLPVEEAVARLTARSADLLGLSDRGRIAPGLRADLVLIDPERFVDTATYEDPCRAPDGVVGVWVAGERVWQDGAHTGARPGGVVA